MNIYVLLYGYVLFKVAESLYQRYFAKTYPNHIFTSSLFNRLVFFWPSAVIYTLFHARSLQFGELITNDWPLLIVLGVCAGIMYKFASIIAREVEASTQQIVRTAGPISLLLFAAVFLDERMNLMRYIGAAILIVTTLVYISHESLRKVNNYMWLAVGTQVIFSINLISEKYLLTKYGLATYIPIGWGAEVLFLAILITPSAIREIRAQKLSHRAKRTMLTYGLISALASIGYITSVNAWKSVSYVNAVSVAQYIITAFAAIYILNEREMISRKIIAIFVAAIGLFLLR